MSLFLFLIDHRKNSIRLLKNKICLGWKNGTGTAIYAIDDVY